MATDLANELTALKDVVDIQGQKLIQQLAEQEQEQTQRAQQLSHYIDNECEKVLDNGNRQYEKTQTLFKKLAESFKNFLINADYQREDFENRLSYNE